jgi:hypothetical protein
MAAKPAKRKENGGNGLFREWISRFWYGMPE